MTASDKIEFLIHQQLGIKPGANDLTPMDYLECKTIAEKFSSQEITEFKTRLKKSISIMKAPHKAGDISISREPDFLFALEEVEELIDSIQ